MVPREHTHSLVMVWCTHRLTGTSIYEIQYIKTVAIDNIVIVYLLHTNIIAMQESTSYYYHIAGNFVGIN